MSSRSRVVELLTDLVAIPSVNPRAGEATGGESAVADYIAAWAGERRYAAQLVDAYAGRRNVYVQIPGSLQGQVLLQSHTDTVEASDMSVPPFTLTRDGGHWYGRGACDAKGQLAVFMAAIEQVTRSHGAAHHGIFLAACIDEEEAYRGVRELCTNALPGVAHAITGAVIGEPTDLRCVVAHKGVLRGSITTYGPGGHSSQSGNGGNSITTMAEVIGYLAGPLNDRLARLTHPLLGSPSLSVTMIEGGEAINILPRRVICWYDQRLLPSQDPTEAWQELKADLEARWPNVTVNEPSLTDYGLNTKQDSEFVQWFSTVLDDCGLDSRPVGTAFGSDASKIARLGIDSVVFGAGSISNAHGPSEFVPDSELVQAVHVISRLLTGASRS